MLESLLDIKRDVEFSIDNDQWKFQIPRPAEKLRRAQLISKALGGAPIESVTQIDYERAFKLATLAVAYVEGPPTFVEKCQKDFATISDDTYIDRLFAKIIEAENRFEESKKKFRPAQGGEKP